MLNTSKNTKDGIFMPLQLFNECVKIVTAASDIAEKYMHPDRAYINEVAKELKKLKTKNS